MPNIEMPGISIIRTLIVDNANITLYVKDYSILVMASLVITSQPDEGCDTYSVSVIIENHDQVLEELDDILEDGDVLHITQTVGGDT
jgi:hypothetical protein